MVPFLLFVVVAARTQVVTGVYKGKMMVDSPKYTIDFELTIKEKDGKLIGYCQRLFIVEDILYYNLVKVTARVEDSVMIVEDEKSVSNNFKEKTSGVKTVLFFKIPTQQDTVSVMPGEWSTSRTKKFLPITGSVSIYREKDYLTTQLYKRLEEKQLSKEMMFEQPVQPTTNLASALTSKTNTGKHDSASKQTNATVPATNIQAVTSTAQQTIKDTIENKHTTAATNAAVVQPPSVTKQQHPKDTITALVQTTANKTTQAPAKNVPQQQSKPVTPAINPSAQTVATAPQQQQVPVTTVTKNSIITDTIQNKKKAVNNKTEPKPVDPKKETLVETAQQQSTLNSVANNNQPILTSPPNSTSKTPVINNPVIIKRQTEIIEALELSDDSVTLSLYDNGEIDGDTVSVFVNNTLLVSKVGMKATAYKQTIAIQSGEIIQLTLFAENLGSIPPNTGLLVVSTSKERYQIHFSSTLNKSSSIVLRRKE